MKETLIQWLQQAFNRYLALDPESSHRLHELKNKVIQVELLGIDVTFQLIVTGKEIIIDPELVQVPHVLVKGSPLSLACVAMNTNERQSFFEEAVQIEGDAAIAQQVIALFDALEIDWEEWAAKKIGDVPAYQLGRLLKGAHQWCRQTKQLLTQDMNDYLHEEIQWFPPKVLLQAFYQDIDDLRMDVDRLEQRLKILEAENF